MHNLAKGDCNSNGYLNTSILSFRVSCSSGIIFFDDDIEINLEYQCNGIQKPELVSKDQGIEYNEEDM